MIIIIIIIIIVADSICGTSYQNVKIHAVGLLVVDIWHENEYVCSLQSNK